MRRRPNGELNLHHYKHVYLYPYALWHGGGGGGGWRTVTPVQSIVTFNRVINLSPSGIFLLTFFYLSRGVNKSLAQTVKSM